MIKAVLIDDEPKNLFILQKLIEDYCEGIVVADTASDAAAGIEVIKKAKPDLLFLDIVMPGKNAFEMLSELMPIDFEVIFVTAFDNYAIKALKIGALDYLLKPVSIDDLRLAVKKVKGRITSGNRSSVQKFLNDSAGQTLTKFRLNVRDGFIYLDVQTILYCQSEGALTYFHQSDGKKVVASGTLKQFEQELPQNLFVRIHHSVIVNLAHIVSYTKGRGGFVTLSDGTNLDVAQRRRDLFLNKFQNS